MEPQSRRLLLAFLLMAAVLAASQWWYSRMAPPPEAGAPADTTGAQDTSKVVSTPVEPGLPDTAAARPDTGAAAAPSPAEPTANRLLVGGRVPRPVAVETPLYRLVVDPRGGTIAQVELLRYPSFTHPGSVTLVPSGAAFLVRSADLGEARFPLGDLVFAPIDSAIRLEAGDPPRTLELRWEGRERRFVQSYRFDPSSYVLDYRLDLASPVDGVLHTVIGPRLESNEKNPNDDYGALRAVARIDGEIVSRSADAAAEGAEAYSGEVEWAGLRNKYFLAMVIEPGEETPLTAATIRSRPAPGDSLPRLEVVAAAPIRQGSATYRVFLGPQEFHRLRDLGHGLHEVSQYGWSWIRWMITPFANWIVVIMLWLHQWVPSYGLVLIVFAILVRVVMWPLTTKSFRSIQEMQKLQPELQRIRETYKKDPQRMQQETMKLYRERKVNPLGGCLPNLLPLPILFALFFVFQSTIEFRGQPFLWLPDLSQPDPVFVLPILMGLTMYVSSKLTQTDPKMAAMTYVMPIVLTFVFLNLAAGLVLYYTVSNVLTFAQQWWLKRSAVAPAAAASG